MRGREEDSEAGSPSSESPLRQALSSKSPTSSSTPILSASLSAPPMHNERSGLDLSRLCRSSEEEGGLYKHLISQLTNGSPKRPAARFQCPVCRKRFQRHIALNAHFQSEHIGCSGTGGRSCKICQTRLPHEPSAMRSHLLSAHRIDLENPAACLIPSESSSTRLSPDEESSVGSSSSSSISSASSERLFGGGSSEGVVKKRRKAPRIILRGEDPSSASSCPGPPWTCAHCSIIFPNQTLYFLHKGFHGELSDPFRCNGCGMACSDMYDFNTHLMSDPHH